MIKDAILSAVYISLALASMAVLVAYRGPFLEEFHHRRETDLWLSLLWPPAVAVAVLISSGYRGSAYLFQLPTDPPFALRLLSNGLILTAMTGRWAEAKAGRFWPRFGAAWAGVVIICITVVASLP